MKLIADDSRMGPLHLKLGKLATIQLLLMRHVVLYKGALQDAEAAVLLLVEDPVDLGLPEGQALAVEYTLLGKRI